MSYVDSSLNPGEMVVQRAHLHKIVFLPALWFLVPALLLLGSPDGISQPRYQTGDPSHNVGWLLLILSLAALTRYLVHYATTEYAVTNRRVIGKWGWISRRSAELLLAKVEGVRLQQSLPGRILDYGTVIVSGTGEQENHFRTIAAPVDFLKAVRQQVEAS